MFEYTCEFIPYLPVEIKEKTVNKTEHIVMGDSTIQKYLGLNRQFRIIHTAKRLSVGYEYLINYKGRFYFIDRYIIYNCTQLSEEWVINDSIAVIHGNFINYTLNTRQSGLLINSNFDTSMLDKKITYYLRRSNNDRIMIINTNLVNYMSKIQKKDKSSLNNIIIPRIKEDYLLNLKNQIESYDG